MECQNSDGLSNYAAVDGVLWRFWKFNKLREPKFVFINNLIDRMNGKILFCLKTDERWLSFAFMVFILTK